MISSIRLDSAATCMQLPGAADTETFVTCVREVLRPALLRSHEARKPEELNEAINKAFPK